MTRIRAMSYNVRYDNRNDHHDAWYARAAGVLNLVRFHHPDVVGFQEPLPGQRRDLSDGLPEYEFVGRGRRVDDKGEGCPVAVRRDRWTIVDDGTFWLSETPAEPSVGWDAAHPRIATWARLERRNDRSDEPSVSDRLDRSVVFVNTHLDHQGTRSRTEAARLLRRRSSDLRTSDDDRVGENDWGDAAVVFVGDLNATAGSPPHRVLTGDVPEGDATAADPGDTETAADAASERYEPLVDAAATADVRHGPTTSITDFSQLIAERRIDHVLVSADVEVEAFATLADRDERGRYPSDHLPVLARLRP